MTMGIGSRARRWLRLAWLAALPVALLGSAGLGSVGLASAEAATPPAAAPSTQAVSKQAVSTLLSQALRAYGPVTVLQTEPGPPGMTAALIASGQQKAIVWIIGNQAVMIGEVRDAQGHNLTRQMAIRMGLVPPPLTPAGVAAAVAKGRTFMVGTKGPVVTAFLDPNCIFCHRLYEDAQPLVAAGKLRLRVVLVAFVKRSSYPRAAAILMAPDPAAALATDEKGFDVQHEEGGIAPATAIPPAVRDELIANTKLLARTGVAATPTLLYQDHAGAWHVMHHGPTKLAAFAASLPG